jgi:hypothetical protein
VSLGSERVSIEADRLRDEPNQEQRNLIRNPGKQERVRRKASERSRGDASDIDGKTDRSKWAGAHESISTKQAQTLNAQSEIRRGERPTPKFRIRKRNRESGTQESRKGISEIEGKAARVAAKERG